MQRLPLLFLAGALLGCMRSDPPAAPPAAARSAPPAPDFALKDLDGNTVTLAQLRGKPVVLSFYFLA
jgi:cytochrome oxidase Cu insertion factor (SCO1/SenC/PrrC family)